MGEVVQVGVFRELFAYRELLWNITLREFKVRYKQPFVMELWDGHTAERIVRKLGSLLGKQVG